MIEIKRKTKAWAHRLLCGFEKMYKTYTSIKGGCRRKTKINETSSKWFQTYIMDKL